MELLKHLVKEETKSLLKQHPEYLIKMRLLLLSLTAFLIALSINHPKAVVSITFDDGLLSEYEAARILEEYGFKGTFYIPAGLLGSDFEDNKVMNYSQVKDLYERGHEIGCHTMTHANLSTLNNAQVRHELSMCKELLKEFNPVSFAYPYGEGTQWEYIVKEYYTSARILRQELNTKKGFNISTLIFVHDRMERLNTLREWLGKEGWIVLTIHGVTNTPRGLIDITPEELREILSIIKESGAQVKTVGEVIRG